MNEDLEPMPERRHLRWLEKWCPCIEGTDHEEWWREGGESYCDSWLNCSELLDDHILATNVREGTAR